MKTVSYILAVMFSLIALGYLESEQHVEWCMTWICALLAFLNAGIREDK